MLQWRCVQDLNGHEGRCWGQINAGTRCVMLAKYSAKKHKDVKIPRRQRQSYITAYQSQLDSEPEGGYAVAAFICRQKMQSDRPAGHADDILPNFSYLRVRTEKGAPGREVDGSRAVVRHHVVRRLAVVRVEGAGGAAAVGSHGGSVAVVWRLPNCHK